MAKQSGAQSRGFGFMSTDKSKIADQFIKSIPHARALGMELTDVGNGMAELAMRYDERFIGDPTTKVIHGGAVFALMDTCCGAAVVSHESTVTSTATIDLRIDYMRPATPGQTIRARAECYHMTRSVAFVRAQTLDDDDSRPVATATGTFTIGRA